jgi:DNA-binding LacI/PurR family transcriptional regulator
LRPRGSNVIGILVTTVTNPLFAEVIVGLEERPGELGYVSLLANTLNDVGRQAQLVTVRQENNVAGGGFCCPQNRYELSVAGLATMNVPVTSTAECAQPR